jgi:hypothetical protein
MTEARNGGNLTALTEAYHDREDDEDEEDFRFTMALYSACSNSTTATTTDASHPDQTLYGRRRRGTSKSNQEKGWQTHFASWRSLN